MTSSDSSAASNELVGQIEALSRPAFRAAVNPERRATLAIGVMILQWGTFDSELGWWVEEMRVHHIHRGLGGLPDLCPSDSGGQLSLLRRLILECGAEPAQLRAFDAIRTRMVAATAIRDDLVHGAVSLGNPDATEDGVCVACMPARKPLRAPAGFERPKRELIYHRLTDIFRTADVLMEDRKALNRMVDQFSPGAA